MPNVADDNLNSDVPVVDPKDDLYGYAAFAESIAKTIQRTQSPHGLVIGLNGEWGSGKSTVFNFVKSYLECKTIKKNEKVIILEFNPWWFNNKDQLATQLLSDLGRKISKTQSGLKNIGKKIGKYAETLASITAPFYGLNPEILKEIFSNLGKDDTLVDLKRNISERLSSSPTRIVILIDDVDRLDPECTCELLKVIKALANFPNVIYLLAYDRKYVADCIQNELKTDGNKFLEKIVQCELKMPAIRKSVIDNIFLNGLNEILQDIPQSDIDTNRFHEIYRTLKPLISTPRTITRIINNLKVTFPMVQGEVDPIDFITIEIVRLNLPNVYDLIKLNPNKFLLTDFFKHQKQEILEFHEGWLKTIEDDRKELVHNILKRLFPRWSDIWDEKFSVSSGVSKQERKYHRISVPDYFDIYFEFSVPSNLGQRNHVRKILNQLDNPQDIESLISELKKYTSSNGNSLAYYFANYIDDNIDSFSETQMKSLVTILNSIDDPVLNCGDYTGRSFLQLPGRFRLEWLFKSLIIRSKIAEDISFILYLIDQSKHLYLLTNYIHVSTTEDPNQQSIEMHEYTQEQKEILITAMIDKYKSLTDEELISQIGLWNILFRWKLWHDKSFQTKLRSILNNPDALLKLLNALYENSNKKFDLNSFQSLIDLDDLYQKVNSVKANRNYSDDDTLQLVDNFHQTYEKFKANPNSVFWTD